MNTNESPAVATSTVDPYAPPTSLASAVAVAEVLQDASRARRFCNYLIDVIGMYVLAIVIGVGAVVMGNEQWVQWIDTLGRGGEYLFGLALMFVYYFPQEVLWGRTLGKLVTRTRAVQADGKPLTARNAMLRTLARFVPFEPLSIFGGEPARAWHDTWPATRVVLIPR